MSDNSKQSHYRAVRKHKLANVKRIFVELNKNTDADILDHLDKQDNRQGYIKRIIREDIAKEKK